MKLCHSLSLAAGLLCAAWSASVSFATVFTLPTIGSNTTKATALPLGPLNPGDVVSGTVGTTSAQGTYALLTMSTAPLAIYVNRLTFADTSAGTTMRSWIYGHNQTSAGAGTTNTAIQTANGAGPGFNQWYSFGKGESIPLNTFGTTTASGPLTLNYTRQAVTPLDGGTFTTGLISFAGTIGADRKHVQVFDGNLEPIQITAGVGLQDVDTISRGIAISYNFAPGTYYLAAGLRNTATTMLAPATSGSRTEALSDYPNMVISGATSINTTSLSLTGTDINGSRLIDIPRGGAYDVQFVKITVVAVPEPTALLAGAAPLLCLTRRPRRA